MKARNLGLVFTVVALVGLAAGACIYAPAPLVSEPAAPTAAPESSAAPASASDWQLYTDAEVGFSIQIPNTWSSETLPDQNEGAIHGTAFTGPEGGVEVYWGVGFGGACPSGTEPVQLAQSEVPACHATTPEGTEVWSQIGYEVDGGNSFSVRAYTNDAETSSHDLVLQVLATLTFMQPAEPQAGAAMVNPASQNCVDQGGTLSIEERGDLGQIGVCYFEDNMQCEEWALMRGDCPVGGVKVTGYATPAARYCAITGGDYAITGNSGADDEQGTCTFKDGSQCDAWDYYNGVCTAGAAPTATSLTIQPLSMEVCDGQAQAMAHALDVLEVTQSEDPLSDPVTGATGVGCQATVAGTGEQFESPDAVVSTLGGMLEDQGWTQDPMLAAGGPTGIGQGYRNGDQICWASALWWPDDSAGCPKDQPVSACPVTPEQQIYTVTLNCGVEVSQSGATQPATTASSATTETIRIPLKEAVATMDPQDVWQNFYDLTQVPRPSHHEEQVRDFLVQFGQGQGLETIVDDVGNVLIRKPASPGMENRHGVILQAHMDMVPQKTPESTHDFLTDPIDAYVEGEWVVADGTTLGADDGSGIAIAMAILASKSLTLGPIEALFTVNEEDGMDGALGLSSAEDLRQPGLLQGDILINLDSENEGEFTIGSAGGEYADVATEYAQEVVPDGVTAYTVEVSGLQGGHSGMDINLGRGHATKLLVRFLKGAAAEHGVRLAELAGGEIANGIPREASALVVVPTAQTDAFLASVATFEETVRSELTAVEPDLSVQASPANPPVDVMTEDVQGALIDLLYANPQGVLRMSDAVPGLVETSTNIGIVNAADGQLAVTSLSRSSVDSELADVGQMIDSVWNLAGVDVAFSGKYSAWTPNPESPILLLMQKVYREMYGQDPAVTAVHAGLECGTIVSKYPGMDAISIGPTLQNVHSPSERMEIASVKKLNDFLIETLKQIPEKN